MQSEPLARSYLFAPGDNEKLLGKVFAAGADAVVLDLEDAVAPANKPRARALVAQTLHARQPPSHPPIYVRINAVSTGYWRDDIAALIPSAVRGIRIGKAETADELRAVDAALTAAERAAGLAPGSLRIVPTIESGSGLLNAAELARCPRVEAFSFGAADFARDLGADPDERETETLFARSQLVLLSRAAGLRPPIASVHPHVKDLAGLRVTSEAARRLGFFGRSCIHPAQIPVIHEVFTPTEAQLVEARAIIAAFEQAMAAGAAVAVLADGQFVDQPIVERARAVVALNEKWSVGSGQWAVPLPTDHCPLTIFSKE